jgi:putative sigma-54 modulation protein
MDLKVKAHHLHITDDLQQFIDRKADHLGRFLDRVTDAALELRSEQRRTGGVRYVAQMTVSTNFALLRAEEEAADVHAAVDAVMAKMERQVGRYRSKWKSRRQGRHTEESPLPLVGDEPEMGDEPFEDATILRTKTFTDKPLSSEEAIEQMELLGHTFFAFINAEDARVNVVYRRRNGGYGLLRPG